MNQDAESGAPLKIVNGNDLFCSTELQNGSYIQEHSNNLELLVANDWDVKTASATRGSGYFYTINYLTLYKIQIYITK